jgi:hypothetical protein
MGVYLCVDSEDGSDTGWDFGLAGDRDLVRLLLDLPRVFPQDEVDEPSEDHFRPADFAAWRRAEAAHSQVEVHNPGRFAELIDLLEAHPTYWVHISW